VKEDEASLHVDGRENGEAKQDRNGVFGDEKEA
jgi:hypothetical protein